MAVLGDTNAFYISVVHEIDDYVSLDFVTLFWLLAGGS